MKPLPDRFRDEHVIFSLKNRPKKNEKLIFPTTYQKQAFDHPLNRQISPRAFHRWYGYLCTTKFEPIYVGSKINNSCFQVPYMCKSCKNVMHACHAFHACISCMDVMHVMHACHACMSCMHVMHFMHACHACMSISQKERAQKTIPGGTKKKGELFKVSD